MILTLKRVSKWDYPQQVVKFLVKQLHTIIDTLPEIVDQALHYQHLDHSKLQDQVNLIKDQMYIREELDKRNLVSFVANNNLTSTKWSI